MTGRLTSKSNFLIAPHNYLKLALLTVHLSPTNVQNLATIFTTIFLCPRGQERSGCAYIRPTVRSPGVQGRISGTIDDRNLKKRILTYNGENNVSGLFTFEWFALIAEKTAFDLGTLDSGERSLPFGLLVNHSCHFICDQTLITHCIRFTGMKAIYKLEIQIIKSCHFSILLIRLVSYTEFHSQRNSLILNFK